MTADIQAILQLLQRQTPPGPPAYTSVSSEYHQRAISVQPVSASQPELHPGAAPPRPQVRPVHVPEPMPMPMPDPLPFAPQSPERAPSRSKETPPARFHKQTLPDGNVSQLLEQRQSAVDSEEQRPQSPRFPAGRQASLPDVPGSSSGMLGLHRPVSDPGLPGV